MIKRHGILLSDPELLYSSSGLSICKMAVQGEKGLVRLVSFGDLAEEMAENLRKRSDVSFVGYFKENVYFDRGGNRHSSTEFVVKSYKERE